MKILRLSIFNLKKNKKEAFVIAFLTMITTLALCIFIANNSKSDKIFEESFKASGSVENLVIIEKEHYRSAYRSILEENYNPRNFSEISLVFGAATDVIEPDGNTISYNLLFLTEKAERKVESFNQKEKLSDEEISGLSHPIWLPVYFRIVKGYKLNDTFTIIRGSKEYPFTVAGFYETGIGSSDGYGYKCVVSEEDYELFTQIFRGNMMAEYTGFAFDTDGEFPYNEFIEKCENTTSEYLKSANIYHRKNLEKANETQFITIFLLLIVFISFVTLIASFVLIRNKINNDIEDQMQQIGVLEALGYRSKEISLSYLLEYVISGGIGAVLGVITAILLTPVQNNLIRSMLGREFEGYAEIGGMILGALAVILAVTLFALLKARTVKKYPPVIAFRKGIKTHSFKKNVMPLENCKGSINFRLSMKSMFQEMRGNIGIAICIIATGTAILFSLMSFAFFKDGTKGLESMMGIDVDQLAVSLVNGADAEKMREEIMADSRVDYAMITYDLGRVNIPGSDEAGSTIIYDDFKNTRIMVPFAGRFPEHDNEIMISVKRADEEKRSIGDSMVLECNGVKKSYIITGTISSLYNGGSGVYLTSAGYRRVNINARPGMLYVFLKDGVNEDEFSASLLEKYGGSVKDMAKGGSSGGTLYDNLSAEAKEKIAVLMSQYGVSSVDYAIRIGDELLTGNSRQFAIKEVRSWKGMIKSQMEPIADATKTGTLAAVILVAVIVAVILAIIAASNVKRQRKSLGIMKSMGYSSKDLMTQIALKIMPVMIVSMIIASVVAIYVNKAFWYVMFSSIAQTDMLLIIAADIAMVIFAFIVTYIGAGKIKKISVTELMTE
jgi:ABC-type antimicrobial peptide transport system permease subunit